MTYPDANAETACRDAAAMSAEEALHFPPFEVAPEQSFFDHPNPLTFFIISAFPAEEKNLRTGPSPTMAMMKRRGAKILLIPGPKMEYFSP